MEIRCERELCTGCTACAAACPMDCIAMVPDAEGFSRPVIDTERCIDCGRCAAVCPVTAEALHLDGPTTAFAAVNSDEDVRRSSTSGGVFTMLCRWVLEREGVVFGAAYDSEFRVVHTVAENEAELEPMRGAKYAQSDLNGIYRQVREFLRQGRYVLFSGTPCQVAGLAAFLGKPQDRLLTVDLICHGVPSPKVWQHYIRSRSEFDADGAAPCAINLRSKETGWPGYSARFDYPQGRSYSAANVRDPYLRGFVGDLYLRPSCHSCRFKGITRCSDFTLGDYWGVWSQLPELHDGKGTSLVLLHSDKARTLWAQIASGMRSMEVNPARALTDNPCALCAQPMPENRAVFFEQYEQADFEALVDSLLPKKPLPKKAGVLRRTLGRLRRVLGAVLKKES